MDQHEYDVITNGSFPVVWGYLAKFFYRSSVCFVGPAAFDSALDAWEYHRIRYPIWVVPFVVSSPRLCFKHNHFGGRGCASRDSCKRIHLCMFCSQEHVPFSGMGCDYRISMEKEIHALRLDYGVDLGNVVRRLGMSGSGFDCIKKKEPPVIAPKEEAAPLPRMSTVDKGKQRRRRRAEKRRQKRDASAGSRSVCLVFSLTSTLV